MQCPLIVSSVLNDESFGMKIAQGCSLFGAITLQEVLNDDTDSGHLLLSSCSTVLLTLNDLAAGERPKVYEADILSGIKQKDVVYISLNETSVKELGLSNGETVDVEIQFQLSRSNFVQMHEAVDAVWSSNNLPLLFPVSPASGQPAGRPLRYSKVDSVMRHHCSCRRRTKSTVDLI